MTTSQRDVIHAYRHLYRHLLHAVQYSTPARYTARDRLRHAFRSLPLADYNAARIQKTLEFLRGAAKVKGLEHRIVKNLMRVWWEQKKMRSQYMKPTNMTLQTNAYGRVDHTIEMLNESMGLCIK